MRGFNSVRTVAVIGAGLIGSGWIATFLANGLAVQVFDIGVDAEADTRMRLDQAWPVLEALGLPAGADRKALSFHADLAEAVAGADFVQENTPERLELKRGLYEALGARVAADVLIASSTSSFSVTELQSRCAHPGRCVLGHPINPVHLVPLVEVVGGDLTSREAIDTAVAFYARLGKQPVRLEKEVFGHVANRLAAAMFQEAVNLVASGVASVDAVDKVIRYGPGLKWAIQGQFMTYLTSGGARGVEGFLDHFGPGQMRRWRDLGHPDLTDPATRAAIIDGVAEMTGDRSVADITAAQDARLLKLRQLLDP